MRAAIRASRRQALVELLDELRMSGYILSLHMASQLSLERVWERDLPAAELDAVDYLAARYLEMLDGQIIADTAQDISGGR